MTREVGLIGTMLGLLMLGGGDAFAQTQSTPSTARGFVNVNVAGQPGSQDVSKTLNFEQYQEPASVTVTHETGGVLFDVTGGAIVRGPWAVGLNFNRRSSTTDGALTGQIPSPIRFDLLRSVSGTVPGINHRETWIAPVVFYDLPVSIAENVAAQAFFGPAFARVTEDVITGVQVTEVGNQPQVSIRDTDKREVSDTLIGFQVGVDLRYAITSRVGAGVLLRYQRATGTLDDDVDVTLGGFQIGGGIRLRF